MRVISVRQANVSSRQVSLFQCAETLTASVGVVASQPSPVKEGMKLQGGGAEDCFCRNVMVEAEKLSGGAKGE